jgi:hypothetical protein
VAETDLEGLSDAHFTRFPHVVQSPTRQELLLRTSNAICLVESAGDPLAVNATEHAVGIGQIRPIMVADVNRILGREKYTLADRWSVPKSFEVFKTYSLYYQPRGTPETWARNWCAGPDGYKQACSLPYWRKVQAAMR